jgi:DhnA family fructose-bisphosphate aldolase class Ia
MGIGKFRRRNHILETDGKTMIVALDPGRSRYIDGMENAGKLINAVHRGGADAIIITYGLLKQVYREIPKDLGIILSIPMNPEQVELAAKVDAHAVKTTFFGDLKDWRRLAPLDEVALACDEYGVLFMPEIVPIDEEGTYLRDVKLLQHSVRMAAERGGDIVKTSYCNGFMEVVKASPIPVIILGGAKMDNDRDVLEMIYAMVKAGGNGVAFGRNIIQHKTPEKIVRAVSDIIHDDASVEEALQRLKVG